MKKKVMFILLFAVLCLVLALNGLNNLTGYQALDLPAPPAPPGMAQQVQPPPGGGGGGAGGGAGGGNGGDDDDDDDRDRPRYDYPRYYFNFTPTDDVAQISNQTDISVIKTLLEDWERRLNTIEQQMAGLLGLGARVDGLESRVQTIENNMRNMGAPVQQPTFTQGLRDLRDSITTNTMVSIGISTLVLLVVVGMLISSFIHKRRDEEHDRELVKQYLHNYTASGYSLDTLKMHLRASGWSDEFVQSVIDEMRRK